MTEPNDTPVEQTQSPSTAGDPVNSPKNGDQWEARYKGLVPTVDKLTARNRDLEAQLALKTSENEQLQAQLGLKDHEKTAAVSERDKQLQEAVTSKTALENELRELRAFKLKVDTAKELKRPDLLKILDKLPNMDDKEALKTVLSDFASFADEAAQERERQLTSGVTPGFNGTAKPAGVPQSEVEWQKRIDSLALGSPERQKAQDEYWDWLMAKHQPK